MCIILRWYLIKMPRSIAFLVTGELRGFLSRSVQVSLRRHALDAMSSADISTLLFALLKLTADEAAMHTMEVVHSLRQLGASRYQLNISAAPTLSAVCPLFIRHWHGALFDHYQAAWRDLAQGFAMIRAYEKIDRQGLPFDWLVKLRADEQLCTPLPTLDVIESFSIGRYLSGAASNHSTRPLVVHQWQPLPRCERVGTRRRTCHATDDHLAIVPREAADRFFSAEREAGATCRAADYASFCAWPAGQMVAVGDVPSECLLGRWLSNGGILVDQGGLLGVRTACMWSNATTVRDRCQCPGSYGADSAPVAEKRDSDSAPAAPRASHAASARASHAASETTTPSICAIAAPKAVSSSCLPIRAATIVATGWYERSDAPPPYTLSTDYPTGELRYCDARRQRWQQYEWRLRPPRGEHLYSSCGRAPAVATTVHPIGMGMRMVAHPQHQDGLLSPLASVRYCAAFGGLSVLL